MYRRNRTRFVLAVIAGLVASCGTLARAEAPYRPNIVMFVVHDLGQHLGCYGVPSVQTPNIDRLAARGVRFENVYSTSGVCSPGRGSLHTGRYPQSNGLMGLTHAPWWWALNDDERHTASYLKELGYETCLVGFQHLGKPPAELGYDRHLSRKNRAAESSAAAADLIRSRKEADKPLFAKIGFVEVHRPFDYGPDTEKGLWVPPWMKETEQIREDLALFQGEIKYFDEQVGRVLDAIDTSEIAAETLVILTGEHGIPYVGAKWTVRKAGMEIPLIMHQPGTVFSGGKIFKHLMSNVDVLPTLLDFLGAPIPDRIEGLSHKAWIEGLADQPPRREVFGQFTPAMKRDNESRSVLTDRYQLIWYVGAGRVLPYPVDVHPRDFALHVARVRTGGARPFLQLYDLQSDPYQLKDVAGQPENAEVVRDLSGRLMTWMKRVHDPLLEGPTATPYYRKAAQALREAAEE